MVVFFGYYCCPLTTGHSQVFYSKKLRKKKYEANYLKTYKSTCCKRNNNEARNFTPKPKWKSNVKETNRKKNVQNALAKHVVTKQQQR